MHILWGLGGMVLLLAIAFALSTDRRAIRPRTVLGALAIQVGLGVLVLGWETGRQVLGAASRGVQAVIDSSAKGIEFLFGAVLPAENQGIVFAFQVLPVIIFFASLTAVLYHWNILQWVVRIIGGGLRKLLGTSQPESLNAAANIFVGQTEAPLVIRPYIAGMTRSEFFAVMVGGLSTVAGSVLVGYSLLGARLEYLIAAAFMAAPGALLMAKIIIPETGTPVGLEDGGDGGEGPRRRAGTGSAAADGSPNATSAGRSTTSTDQATDQATDQSTDRATDPSTDQETEEDGGPRNVIDAAASGASDGLKLALNIGAMLIAFISLIAMINLLLGAVGGLFGYDALTFEQILGYLFAPVMFALGVPWGEAVEAGSFVGQKLVLNEFVAFSNFGPVAGEFGAKTSAIVTFALTGFANFSSLGILLGGLGGLVPERRSEIAHLGLRAVLAGTLANLMSATIAGILIG